MAQGISAGLGPNGEPVRLLADGDRGHRAAPGVEAIDHIVEPTREPEIATVRRDVAHVGTATAGNLPGRDHLAGGEVDDRDAAHAVLLTFDPVRAAVGDI